MDKGSGIFPDPDPDPGDPKRPDPAGSASGSPTLLERTWVVQDDWGQLGPGFQRSPPDSTTVEPSTLVG